MRIIVPCLVSLLALTSAFAAEVAAPVRSIAVTADAPKPTGEITVRLAVDDKDGQLTGLTIAANNLKVEAPREALTGIVRPRAETLAVFVDADKGTIRILLRHGDQVTPSANVLSGPTQSVFSGQPQTTWLLQSAAGGKLLSRTDQTVFPPPLNPRTPSPSVQTPHIEPKVVWQAK